MLPATEPITAPAQTPTTSRWFAAPTVPVECQGLAVIERRKDTRQQLLEVLCASRPASSADRQRECALAVNH